MRKSEICPRASEIADGVGSCVVKLRFHNTRGSHFKTVNNRFGVASHAARERKKRACERRAATIKAEGQGDNAIPAELMPCRSADDIRASRGYIHACGVIGNG